MIPRPWAAMKLMWSGVANAAAITRSLVLPVAIVQHDDHTALAQLLEDLGNGMECEAVHQGWVSITPWRARVNPPTNWGSVP